MTFAVKASIGAMAALLALPLSAQSLPITPAVPTSQPARPTGDDLGHTAATGVGEVGQRQTTRDVQPNSSPLDRISSRIENRIENRIQNRIDRYYDSAGDAATPVEKAAAQARTAGRPR